MFISCILYVYAPYMIRDYITFATYLTEGPLTSEVIVQAQVKRFHYCIFIADYDQTKFKVD